MFNKFLARLGSVFVIAAVGAIPAGAMLGVATWKSALQAGAAAALNVLLQIAIALKDGYISRQEAKDLLDE